MTDGIEESLRRDVPFIDEVRPVESWSFSTSSVMAANWKVVVDNFLECYHCDKAHPDFCDLFEMSAYQTEIGRWWSVQRGPKVRTENTAYRVGSEEPVQTGMFWFLWPTTTINMLPGDAGLSVASILPHGIDHASFSGDRYALPGTEEDPERSRYLNEVLIVEDQNLCESVQRGLRSRSYNQGRFIYVPDARGISEHAVHHFHRLVHEALEGSA